MQDKQNKQNNLDRVLTFSFAPCVSSPRAGLCEVLRRPGWTAAQSGPVDVCSTAVQMPRVSPNSSNIIKYSKNFQKKIPKQLLIAIRIFQKNLTRLPVAWAWSPRAPGEPMRSLWSLFLQYKRLVTTLRKLCGHLKDFCGISMIGVPYKFNGTTKADLKLAFEE